MGRRCGALCFSPEPAARAYVLLSDDAVRREPPDRRFCDIWPADRAAFRGGKAPRPAENKVAGREWWYEEATLTTPEPAEPHGTQEMRRT